MTATQIAALEPFQILRDDHVPGLHVRAFKGRKVFYLYYRTLSGTERRPKIGDAAILSIAEARRIAADMLTAVACGRDPSQEKSRLRDDATIEELYGKTVAGHWSAPRYRKSGYLKEVEGNFRRYILPRFSKRKVLELRASEIREWHASLSDKPYAANRALEILSRLYSFAEEMEWIPQGSNPCTLVKAHPEAQRTRYATDEEIKKVGEILERERESHPREVAFITLLMLTGSRPSALARARRSDLVRKEAEGKRFGILTVEGKTGRENVVIPQSAMALLDLVHGDGSGEGDILLGRFPRYFWDRVRKEAGCPDLWARDWRRTFATTGMSAGFEMPVISELLNHKSAQTTMIYAKLKDSARASVAMGTAAKIEGLIRSKP